MCWRELTQWAQVAWTFQISKKDMCMLSCGHFPLAVVTPDTGGVRHCYSENTLCSLSLP